MSHTIEKRVLVLDSTPEMQASIMDQLRVQLSHIEQPGPWDGHPFPGATLEFQDGIFTIHNVKNIHSVSYESDSAADKSDESIVVTYYVYVVTN